MEHVVGLFRVVELVREGDNLVRIPIMGQALCAGFPSPADDFIEGALELSRWFVPNPPATFLMRVRERISRRSG
jgi:DNA polymerase V